MGRRAPDQADHQESALQRHQVRRRDHHHQHKIVGAYVEVAVADDGDGVPAEDESTIFLPYRRSTQGRRDKASIGLGLWICRQLAHGMGGSLHYERAPVLTEFVLSLPVSEPGGNLEREDAGAVSGKRAITVESAGRANMTPAMTLG